MPLRAANAQIMLAACLTSCGGPPQPALTDGERQRGERWLADQPSGLPHCSPDRAGDCRYDGVGDVDRDGVADCWRLTVINQLQWQVWRGCRGEPLELVNSEHEDAVYMIPPEYSAPQWLVWLARAASGRVACVDLDEPDCRRPSARWQWLLDATFDQHHDQIALHGKYQAAWQPGVAPEPVAGEALIVADGAAGWLARQPLPEFLPPHPAPRGPRIITAQGGPITQRLDCGGLAIALVGGGVVAIDRAERRWRWIYSPLPHYGGGLAELACHFGLVVATDSSQSTTAIIEPRSGGWLFEPATDVVGGAGVWVAADGDALWPRDSMESVRLSVLREWLALDVDQRPPLHRATMAEFAGLPFTEEGELIWDDGVANAALSITRASEEFGPRSLDLVEVAASKLMTTVANAHLTPRGSCGGVALYGSQLAIIGIKLANPSVGWWLMVEQPQRTLRIRSIACDRGRIVIEQMRGHNLLGDRQAEWNREHVFQTVLDIAADSFEVRELTTTR